MEIKVEIELGIAESTKQFIRELIASAGPKVVQAVVPAEVKEAAKAEAVAPAEPAEEKKSAKKAKKAEPVQEPEPEPVKAEEPKAEKPQEPAKEETVDYAKKRQELRAFCSKRKAEGVNISGLIQDFLGKKGAKFSEIPDERLVDFEAIVKAAEA